MQIVFLDTETTGIDLEKDDIVELSIISLENSGKKSYLFNKLFKTRRKCTNKALQIHGITDEMRKEEKHITFYYDELKAILNDKKVIIYNADFDVNLINYVCKRYKKEPLLNEKNCFCLMEDYAAKYGKYNKYSHTYRWVKLENAFNDRSSSMKIPEEDLREIKAHRALGDCIMTKYLYIATKDDKYQKDDLDDDWY